MTTLIACSHGTRFAEGRRAVADLVSQVAALLPDVRVLPAFVDVEEPAVADVVAGLAPGEPVVVVPLLLSRGFHTGVDIAQAVEGRSNAVAAEPLGPHPLLADVLVTRLAEIASGDAGHRPGDHVVLAASGSTNPVAVEDVERVRALLQDRLPVPVTVGYAAGASPRISDAVADARAAGADRVVVASYVLAPGFFADLVAAAGGDEVSAPLCRADDSTDIRVAQVVAERFRAVLPR